MRVRALLAIVTVAACTAAAAAPAAPRSGSPAVIAPLIRVAIALEKDAQKNRGVAKDEAARELRSSAAALRHALALAPAAGAADLRQALTKDVDALSLLRTNNDAKVRLDLATALNRKEAALAALGERRVGPLLPPTAAAKVEAEVKKEEQKAPPPAKTLSRPQIADLVDDAISREEKAGKLFDQGAITLATLELLHARSILRDQAMPAAEADGGLANALDLMRIAAERDGEAVDDIYEGRKPFPSFDGLVRNALLAKRSALSDLDEPQLAPIEADFDQATYTTTYTEEAVGRGLSFAWSVAIPDDSDCAKGFRGNAPQPNQAEWFHADKDAPMGEPVGPCDHTKMVPFFGHPGTVSVVVSNADWTCSALYHGTEDGEGPKPTPCTRR